MAAIKGIDWSHLAEDYALLGSQAAVAAKYGCTNKAVSKQMRKKGLRVNRFDWSNLESDYQTLGTQAAVAKKYGCTPSMVNLMVTTILSGAVEGVKIRMGIFKSIVLIIHTGL